MTADGNCQPTPTLKWQVWAAVHLLKGFKMHIVKYAD